MVSWTCRRALLNWPTLRSGGVFRLRGAAAISQQGRAAQGLLGKMSSRGILEGDCYGKISPRCVFGLPAMAVFRRGAFSGVQPWRDYAVVCSREAIRGSFSLHAFPKGPRTGKAPVRGNISPPCIRNEPALARYSRHASEKRRKQPSGNTPCEDLARKGPFSLRGPLRSCTACGSCRRSALAGCWALCVKGLGPGCVSALRIAADGPACRHGISLRSAAAAYPAANASPCGTLHSQSRSPRCDRPAPQPMPRPLSVGSGFP